MLNSMTGFGRSYRDDGMLSLQLEIRSLNSRFLDINFKMPSLLNEYEENLKSKISKKIARGKLEVAIRINEGLNKAISYELNPVLVDNLKRILYEFTRLFGREMTLNFGELLRIDDVLIKKENENKRVEILKNLEIILYEALDESLAKLIEHRELEGANIKKELRRRLENIEASLLEIEGLSSKLNSSYQQRLLGKMKEVIDEYNCQKIAEDRVLLELVTYSDKTDISEEIMRLRSHLKLFALCLEEEKKEKGKRLDFLSQEINREINTIGSKSCDSKLTALVVDMKCENEKLREQIQNVE